MKHNLRAIHLPYWISQFYLPPNTIEHTPPYPQPDAGTRFPEGWKA